MGTHQGASTRKEGEYNYTLYAHRDEYFECDLMDVYGRRASDVVKVNEGYVFLLLVINAQTKMVYFRPLRGKGGSEVAESLYDIFTNDIRPDTSAFHEILLHCDHGKEFYNAHVSKITNKLGIHLYSSQSDNKAAVVERSIRTIRGRLVRAMEMNGESWISLIARVVNLYNNAYNRSIGMSPFEAVGNFPKALFNLAQSRERENKEFSLGSPKFSIGDIVRLKVKAKTAWRKGALRKFTNEVFRIVRVRKTSYKYVYTVNAMDGEHILGQFDANMLKPAVEERLHKIQILGERVRNGIREVRVHWDGYPQSADEWVGARQVDEES